MRGLVFLLPLITLAMSRSANGQAVAAPAGHLKPNIIYILADDLGYGDLGCYGQQITQTPNIDRLAREGMLFTQHYAGSTVCAPSRSTLLTGQHTGHTYIRFNGDYQMRPDPDDITVARYLKDAGYATAMIGKSSTGCITDAGQPNEKGFDHFFGYLSHAQAHSYFPKYLYRNRERIDFPGNGGNETWRGQTYSPDLILDEALAFIEDKKEEPFFLLYASPLPHAQVWAPESFEAPYLGKVEEMPFAGRKPDNSPVHYGEALTPNATTAAMIARLDWEVGQIIQRLEAMGLAEHTIVLFSSDNGPHREGGRNPGILESSGPFRGIKRDLYEGGIRTPFIVRWPAVVAPGSRSDLISAFWDVLPTLTDIAGVESPSSIDGISFLPTLMGTPEKQRLHDYLYWEFYEQGGKQAIRKGNWKAVRHGVSENPDALIELYDLTSDPGEQHNIAGDYPGVVREMAGIFSSARVESTLKPLIK